MNRFSFLFFLVSAILCCGSSAAAQSQDIRFEHFSTAEGLNVDIGNGPMLQGRRGFLWVGNVLGLDRYDGYSFTHFLPGHFILALAEDHEGMIWAGGLRGARHKGTLWRFDPETNTETSFQNNADDPSSLSGDWVQSLYIDRAGVLWVGTNQGLDRLERETSTPGSSSGLAFTHFQHDPDDPNSLSFGTVQSIYQDQEGILWIGTAASAGILLGDEGGGLSRFDPQTETFTRYQHDPSDPYSLIDDRVSLIKADRQGTLYVGTCQSGLHRYDRVLDRFERLNTGEDNPTGSIATTIGASYEVCPHVSIIHEDNAGAFWVGIFSGGLKRSDRRGVTSFVHNPLDPHSLSSNEVYSMYEDRQGTLWVGTMINGLNKIVPSPDRWFKPFVFEESTSNSVDSQHLSLLEDRSGRLWIGRRGVLYQVDAATGALLNAPIHFSSAKIDGLYEDRSGMIWVGISPGFVQIDPHTGAQKRYFDDPDMMAEQGEKYNVNSFIEDQAGIVWVSTHAGVHRLDRSTDTITHYQHDQGDPSSLAGRIVWPILEDRNGTLWFGTEGGLSRYDHDQDRFTTFFEGITINALFEDTQGRFWVCTWGAGLYLFNPTTGASTSFTTADGLPNNIVGGLLEDDQGFLWIITPGGLSRFTPGDRHFVNFTEADGFPNALTNPEQDDFLINQHGDLLIGGTEGVTVVALDQLASNPNPPAVVVTGLQVFDEPMAVEGLLPASLALTYDRNDLTFEYVGLHFAEPEKNRYAYRLEGYDADWIDAGTERTARYTNLDPDVYVFRVKAANRDGVWNEEGARLEITIRPPWWQTTWAYLLYALLFIAGVFVTDRIQRRRLIKQERDRAERERQTKELEQARQLQLAMLPQAIPSVPHIHLAAYMATAAEVGGDFYDFEYHPPNGSDDLGALNLIIGDATGHGTEAGMVVTAAKGILSALPFDDDLSRVLQRSSFAMRRMRFRKLFMALAIARLRGHTLELAGAGMPPALVYRAATQQVEQIPLKGMPLGGPAQFPYQTTCVSLAAGDTVILMSDGFPELFNKAGEMLGYEEAISVFAEVAARSPEEIIAHLRETGETWSNGRAQDDDVTFLVMRVKEG